MVFKITALILSLAISQTLSWEALPQIPTGHRSQFLVLHEDGGYKYGYDTGDGSAAKQSGDSANQVAGHYFYKNGAGQDVDLKYTAGVQGFVPENLDQLLAKAAIGAPAAQPAIPSAQYLPAVVSRYSAAESSESSDDQAGTGDASYAFSFDTGNYKRQESSDARNNVQGSYSYSDGAGVHDLMYIAGENTGFVATSGSLSKANGLTEGASLAYKSSGYAPSTGYAYPAPASAYSAASSPNVNPDGSYSFAYSTSDSSRQESADSANNVQGRYSYQNGAGSHDLSYVAGAATGFQVTGGSLAQPNGLGAGSAAGAVTTYSAPAVASSYSAPSGVAGASADGSYSFGYNTGDSSRQESADSANNVQGRYSYQNGAGSHDLSYVAGASTGFQVTGGSLAQPNGLGGGSAAHAAVSAYSAPVVSAYTAPAAGAAQTSVSTSGDGSYSFGYNTGDSARQESSDASGNVKGSYSYKNAAGNHDLSYVAGSSTGFLPTGGSLSVPNGIGGAGSAGLSVHAAPAVLLAKSSAHEESDDQANTGDASYSFSIDTDDYKRQESSDASGNVKGAFSYKNGAGTHDLSFVAGSQTGFLPTGGSLSDPNAITAKIAAFPAANSVPSVPLVRNSLEGGEEQSSGDASYSFSIDTADYQRHESSDAGGNVQGSYSYKNSAGNHDLSFVAGSSTGFLPTGGSLKIAPGLGGTQLRSSAHLVAAPQSYSHVAPSLPNSLAPSTKSSYKLGNIAVHTYLPPANEKRKFGYILDTV